MPTSEPLLSVRGEASRFVDPDQAELSATVELIHDSAPGAVAAVTASVDSVRRELQRLGGVVREAFSLRQPLTWVTRRVTTSPEWGEHSRTGRTIGTASLSIFLRDFDLLAEVEPLTSSVPGLRFDHVVWEVDPVNPAWRQVRLEAIDAALRKARDYADALGSSLVSVEHVADLGLLDAEPMHGQAAAAMPAAFAYRQPESTLDPVPQQLVAAIEARFRMAPVPLNA